ncbi:MAG TPA: LLM class flavin-dependent oxidoreductase, partial [Dehalococcoidia bacterium]|nr:LLM class flavin-dependent oxidoreductase [Dehalococcoidia bacterium]
MQGGQPKNIDKILDMAETAEQAGVESVWVGDSLTAKPRLEPLTVLAAVAARTRRVRLGTGVMLGALRHPVLLSHAAATVDLISEGRLVLGMGVGGAFNDAQRQEWKNA